MSRQLGECLHPHTQGSEGVAWMSAPWNRNMRILASKLRLLLIGNTGWRRKMQTGCPALWMQTLLFLFIQCSFHK